jgi:hypothetical protein
MLQFANDRIRIRSIIRKLTSQDHPHICQSRNETCSSSPSWWPMPRFTHLGGVSIFLVGVILLGIVTAANSPRCFQGRLVLYSSASSFGLLRFPTRPTRYGAGAHRSRRVAGVLAELADGLEQLLPRRCGSGNMTSPGGFSAAGTACYIVVSPSHENA